MFKSFYLFIYAGCLDCVAASSIRLPFFGFPHTVLSARTRTHTSCVYLTHKSSYGGSASALPLCRTPSLSPFFSQFDSERNGQLHVLIAACNCPATATQLLPLPLGSACVAVAVAVAAAAVLRWLCTCDNIFIIFASFLLLPLLRCHRHWHRRIANGRCVCKH